MKLLKDRNHVSVVPKFWTDSNGHREQWKSEFETYETFYARIVAYCEANQRPVPSSEEVQNTICAQLPAWNCVGEGYFTPTTPSSQRARPCGGCGRKK